MTCPAKHTKFQPTNAEWLCPKCGSDNSKFVIDENVPDEDAIRSVLLKVLEQHYGSLEGAVKVLDAEKKCLWEIQSVLQRYGFH